MTTTTTEPTIQEQAGALVGMIAGYVGHRTIGMGLRAGLVAALAAAPGLDPDELAERCDLDPFYTSVWCRAAVGAGLVDRTADGGLRLAPHLETILLDDTSPAYLGGTFLVFEQDEMFGRFERELASGERLWWDETSPTWIASVAGTGRPFYTRLVPGGLAQVPGLEARLEAGVRIVDTACGSGIGVARLATTYPASTVVGVDGDAHSLEAAAEVVAQAGVADRTSFVHSPLETFTLDEPATVVINNISMHECRDIDEVTRRVWDALEPGGWFVISDFPFPETDEGLRTGPGRLLTGIQFFEAQIDDQLLPRAVYDDLLARHGFVDIDHVDLTPTHALTWGRRPS